MPGRRLASLCDWTDYCAATGICDWRGGCGCSRWGGGTDTFPRRVGCVAELGQYSGILASRRIAAKFCRILVSARGGLISGLVGSRGTNRSASGYGGLSVGHTDSAGVARQHPGWTWLRTERRLLTLCARRFLKVNVLGSILICQRGQADRWRSGLGSIRFTCLTTHPQEFHRRNGCGVAMDRCLPMIGSRFVEAKKLR